MFLVGRQHPDDRRARRQQRALLHRAGAVARGGMDDFVRQHRRQFRLALQFRQQAAIDRQLAAGKGPGIGHRIVDDDELERQVRPVADLHQLLPDLVDVGRKLRIEDELATGRLLVLQILLAAELDFLLLGYQRQFGLLRHRVGRAAAHRKRGKQRKADAEQTAHGRARRVHELPSFCKNGRAIRRTSRADPAQIRSLPGKAAARPVVAKE
jgi:hypothetical protein